MVLKTKEENRTNAQYKPLRLRVELVHLFPLVVQKLSSLIITKFTKYKSNSLSKPFFIKILSIDSATNFTDDGTSTGLSDLGLASSVTAPRRGSVTVIWYALVTALRQGSVISTKEIASPVRAKLSSPRRSFLTLSV